MVASKRVVAVKAEPKKKPSPPPPTELAKYGVPDHKPSYCCWTPVTGSGCANPSGTGLSYLGRELCEWHWDILKCDKYPAQLIAEALNLPPTPEEKRAWHGQTFSQREDKDKGAPCSTCQRNVPDVSPGTARVWCHRCVMHGKFDGSARNTTEWLEVNALRKEGKSAEADELAARLLSRPRPASSGARRVGGPAKPKEASGTLKEISEGKQSLIFDGTKGKNTFTQGSKPGTVAVADHKGITTYELSNGDHNRIVQGRLDRWMRKGEEPTKREGKVPIKGPKLEVRIKSGEEA